MILTSFSRWEKNVTLLRVTQPVPGKLCPNPKSPHPQSPFLCPLYSSFFSSPSMSSLPLYLVFVSFSPFHPFSTSLRTEFTAVGNSASSELRLTGAFNTITWDKEETPMWKTWRVLAHRHDSNSPIGSSTQYYSKWYWGPRMLHRTKNWHDTHLLNTRFKRYIFHPGPKQAVYLSSTPRATEACTY